MHPAEVLGYSQPSLRDENSGEAMSKAALVFVLVVTFTAGASFLRSGSPTAQPRQATGTSQVDFADKENGKAAAETPLENMAPGQRAMTVKAMTSASLAKPGNRVDILCIMPDLKTPKVMMSKIIFKMCWCWPWSPARSLIIS
jgi:hypothetical protein